MEDGWLDGRLLTCPRASVHAAALPAQHPGPHRANATGEASLATLDTQQADGTYGTRDSHASGTMGSIIPQTTEFLVSSKKEMARHQVPQTSAGQQGQP